MTILSERLADPRIAKLPRWADALITDLARALARAEDARDAEAHPPTRVAFDPNARVDGSRPRFLPESSPVRFSLDDVDAVETNSYVDVTTQLRSGHRVVIVRGCRGLVISPVSGNTVEVWEDAR